MTYTCIKCREIWIDGEPSAELSGGLCLDCITAYVRNRQTKQGFQDCFRKAVELCSLRECSYWLSCNKEIMACLMDRKNNENQAIHQEAP